MSFSLVLLGAFELAFAFWAVMSLYRAVDNIRLLFTFDQQDEPSLKYLLVAYSFWFVGLALLCVGMGAAFWSYRGQIFENPWLVGIAVVALATAPISEHLFQKSTGEHGDDSNFLAVISYLRYTFEQGQRKTRARLASPKIPAKYLENANISARAIAPSLRYLRQLYGDAKTKEIVESMGVPLEYLTYHESKLHVSFALDLLGKIKELTGDPKAAFYAQSCGGNLESMGSVFFLISRYCSLKRCYEMFTKSMNQFDTVMNYQIIEGSKNHIVIRIIPKDFEAVKQMGAAGQDGIYSCQGWWASLPNLKGLPHAVIKERVCMFKYQDEATRSRYSEFEIHWVNRLEDGAMLLKKAA